MSNKSGPSNSTSGSSSAEDEDPLPSSPQRTAKSSLNNKKKSSKQEQALIHPKPKMIRSIYLSCDNNNKTRKNFEIPCLCCDSFFSKSLGDLLTHLADMHRVVIAKIEQVPLPHKYFKYWKERLASLLSCGKSEEDCLKEIMYGIGDAKSSDPSKVAAFFLDANMEEDRKLREKLHAEHLQQLLDFQHEERMQTNFARQCLFCKEICKGNRKVMFAHMMEAHGFNIGLPDNLVYVNEFLDILSENLDRCLCIFCEKEFKSHSVLRIHMRKKKHFKINAQNPIYDRFYLINHLELGKNWEAIQNEDDGEPEGVKLEGADAEETVTPDILTGKLGDMTVSEKELEDDNDEEEEQEGGDNSDHDDGFTLVTTRRRRTTSGSVASMNMGMHSTASGRRSGSVVSRVSTCMDEIPDEEWEEWEEDNAEPESVCLFCGYVKYGSAASAGGDGVAAVRDGGGFVNAFSLPVENDSSSSDNSDGEDVGGSGEGGNGGERKKCGHFETADECFEHMRNEHKFDFFDIQKTLELDFYSRVKLVNYVRKRVKDLTCIRCDEYFDDKRSLLTHMQNQDHFNVDREQEFWSRPEYFFPTYEADALLCHLEDASLWEEEDVEQRQ